MPREMLGDKVLPEAIQSRRRKLRSRVMDIREPLRTRRERNVPGPDVIGKAESTVSDLRARFVNRTTVPQFIQEKKRDDTSSGVREGKDSSTTQNTNKSSGNSNSRAVIQ